MAGGWTTGGVTLMSGGMLDRWLLQTTNNHHHRVVGEGRCVALALSPLADIS